VIEVPPSTKAAIRAVVAPDRFCLLVLRDVEAPPQVVRSAVDELVLLLDARAEDPEFPEFDRFGVEEATGSGTFPEGCVFGLRGWHLSDVEVDGLCAAIVRYLAARGVESGVLDVYPVASDGDDLRVGVPPTKEPGHCLALHVVAVDGDNRPGGRHGPWVNLEHAHRAIEYFVDECLPEGTLATVSSFEPSFTRRMGAEQVGATFHTAARNRQELRVAAVGRRGIVYSVSFLYTHVILAAHRLVAFDDVQREADRLLEWARPLESVQYAALVVDDPAFIFSDGSLTRDGLRDSHEGVGAGAKALGVSAWLQLRLASTTVLQANWWQRLTPAHLQALDPLPDGLELRPDGSATLTIGTLQDWLADGTDRRPLIQRGADSLLQPLICTRTHLQQLRRRTS
jgi:hypothetical protein